MLYVTVIGALFLTWFVLVLLFTPALNYRMRVRVPVSSPDFLHFLESTCRPPRTAAIARRSSPTARASTRR